MLLQIGHGFLLSSFIMCYDKHSTCIFCYFYFIIIVIIICISVLNVGYVIFLNAL